MSLCVRASSLQRSMKVWNSQHPHSHFHLRQNSLLRHLHTEKGTSDPNEHLIHDKNAVPIKTTLKGRALLNNSVLNKGTAFTREERKRFDLESFLPYEVHDLSTQRARAWEQLNSRPSKVLKFSFLSSMRDQNQVLYYSLLHSHIKELLPIIYTPTVGDAIQQYSHLFRRPVGAYLTIKNQERMEEDLLLHKPENEVDLIVCTDAEGILGIGDQGVGGTLICIGKSAVYTIGAGIDPSRILPVVLDVGTNNTELLNDPLYLGWKHKRVSPQEYDAFVNKFCDIVRKRFPDALLHFEDFGASNAQRLLDTFRPKQSCFNDDIQGTAAVVLSSLMSALHVTKQSLKEQKIVVYGFGSAGLGIASFIKQSMVLDEGLSEDEAASKIWGIDRNGLLTTDQELRHGQDLFAKDKNNLSEWSEPSFGEGTEKNWGLLDVIKNVKPTILIGCSTHAGSFNEEVVKEMCKHVERPVIFPLSNPTSKTEADPSDLYHWSNGRALITTGTPFPPIKTDDGKTVVIGECNNALIYPGLALGTIISRATSLTDKMITAGARELAALSPALQDPERPLLPDLANVREVSCKVATAVANAAIEERTETEGAKEERKRDQDHGKDGRWTEEMVRKRMWDPVYRPLEYSQDRGPLDDQLLTGTW
ncbi:hypothetical protein BT69DRAFT_1328654 [Atractiella rhizophila]|nr:hypothetical protein BT69DRAFT_1328654 [Atractiella rhizophila]